MKFLAKYETAIYAVITLGLWVGIIDAIGAAL